MALNSEDKDIFIMGTEPGTIFQGKFVKTIDYRYIPLTRQIIRKVI